MCTQCDGRGAVVQVRRMGPMIQQVQTSCPKCGGTGKDVAKGVNKLKKEKYWKFLLIKVLKTARKLNLMVNRDEHPGLLPGDVIFVVQEKSIHVSNEKVQIY